MNFAYQALNETGGKVSGLIEADNQDEANLLLAEKGFVPVSLKPKTKGGYRRGDAKSSWRLSRIKPQELILFTKQFQTLYRAGIPVMETLRTLQQQTQNKKLQDVAAKMTGEIKEGDSLYNIFSRHKQTFSALYCSMIHAGENSGTLPEVLERLIYILEHEDKVKRDIKTALTYPIIVVVALFCAFVFLLTFVIPKFVDIYKQAELELPLPTQVAMGLYQFMLNFWPFYIPGLILVIAALFFYFRTSPGRLLLHKGLLRIPLIGPVFQKAAMSRFASIFSILQKSGISVLDSLDILSSTIGNTAISREFEQIKNKLKEGFGISGPLSSGKYFTPMVVNMTAVGEEAGNLDEMLQEVSSHYDTEVEYAITQMTTHIGPILILSLAGVVGFFALAIFLPMWDLTKMV